MRLPWDELFALHPIDIHDLLVADLPKPPELVKGILHQGSKMVIGGGSKSFKTWTLLDLAVSVAAGVPWWGFETTKGRALYVNFEIQDAFFRDRMSGSGVFARDPDSILMMTPHEEESVFVVDCILRNLPPIENFCVARAHPLMVRSGEHDPSKLKTARGNEEKYSDDEILAPLREAGSLRNGEWKKAVCAVSKMGERTFAMRLRKLVSRGIVTKDGEQYIEVTKATTTRTNESGGKKTSFVQGPRAE